MNANLEEVIEVVIVLFSCGGTSSFRAAPLMDWHVSSALWVLNRLTPVNRASCCGLYMRLCEKAIASTPIHDFDNEIIVPCCFPFRRVIQWCSKKGDCIFLLTFSVMLINFIDDNN